MLRQLQKDDVANRDIKDAHRKVTRSVFIANTNDRTKRRRARQRQFDKINDFLKGKIEM